MPATKKSLRQAPNRSIQDYTLYHIVGENAGLTKISDLQMQFLWSKDRPLSERLYEIHSGTTVIGSVTIPAIAAGAPGANDGLSKLKLPFRFEIDNQIYDELYVATIGYCILHKSSETFSLLNSWSGINHISQTIVPPWPGHTETDYSLIATSADYTTQLLNSNKSSDIMLCPWCNTHANNLETQHIAFSGWTTRSLLSQFGIVPSLNESSTSKCGVRYYVDNYAKDGKRLIVRWTSYITSWNIALGFHDLVTIYSFECVLYENGKIEFRYSPKTSFDVGQTLSTVSSSLAYATVGIFGTNNTITKRFRDFSIELSKYNTIPRYKKGGLITGSISNPTSGSMVTNLTFNNWPSQNNQGATFVFAPPKNKIKILPKQHVKLNDQTNTHPINTKNVINNKISYYYDDRLTSINQTEVVSFPSKLTRYFAGNTITTFLNQTLFENDLEITGSSQNAFDYLKENNQIIFNPYNEYNKQISITNNEFESGSLDLPANLHSKQQISIQLPIDIGIKLLTTQSAIYYYDCNHKAFLMKGIKYTYFSGTTLISSTLDTDITNPVQTYVDNGAIPEDHKGFGPYGNNICSGNLTPVSGTSRWLLQAQASKFTNYYLLVDNELQSLLHYKHSDALTEEYANSICVNQNYNATNNETFTLPITHPFVIEKAIIEFPIQLGTAWFNDTTKMLQPLRNVYGTDDAMYVKKPYTLASGLAYGAPDAGGPAITFGLFTQKQIGDDLYRDLILSATFTHQNDNKIEPKLLFHPSSSLSMSCGYIEGFNAGGGTCSLYVNSASNGMFTGTISLATDAAISNGLLACYQLSAKHDTLFDQTTMRNDLLNSSFVNIKTLSLPLFLASKIYSINNFGRTQKGFQNGRSIFGKEYILKYVNKQLENYFYVSSSKLPNNFYDHVSVGLNTPFQTYVQPISFVKHEKSPYIIYPNERLVFSISKTRPVVCFTTASITSFGNTFNGTTDYFNGQWHDVQIPSGSQFKITLFGSYLKEGKEYLPCCNNETLATNEIHESISDYVLDQFQTYDRFEYQGTYNDAFMGVNNPPIYLEPNQDYTRKRLFSITNANHTDHFTSSIRLSTSYIEQYTYAGLLNNNVLTTDDEIYYDSIIPNIQDLITINNGEVFKVIETSYGVAYGGIYLSATDAMSGSLKLDRHFLKCFPYESKYSNVMRNFNKRLIFNTEHTFSGTSTPININDTTEEIGFVYLIFNNNLSAGGFATQYNDANMAHPDAPNVGMNLTHEDLNKIFFGMGTRTLLSGSIAIKNVVDNKYSTYGANITGWKYGLLSGIQTNTNCIFRRDHFGYHRDMLEQRPYTKVYSKITNTISDSPISVRFIHPLSGTILNPSDSSSSNLHYECTSSLPYFDGMSKNR